jgi:hypothetical protein
VAHGNNIEFGVNVYVVVPLIALFIVEGDQVPVIPLLDVKGRVGVLPFKQIGAMAVKVGVVVEEHGVLQVTVSGPTQETPFAEIVNVTD